MSSLPIASTAVFPLPAPSYAGHEDLISVADLAPEEAHSLLEFAQQMKSHPAEYRHALAGKQMAMFFEKPSLRTRLTFEAGMASMGGMAFFVDQTQARLGVRESLKDVAKNLERWVDVLVLRTFDHATVTGIAEHAGIPVINALTDLEHPCQALADYMTLKEHFGSLKGLTLAYVGDGNNMAHSLMLAGATLGVNVKVATPAQYAPLQSVVEQAKFIAVQIGTSIQVMTGPLAAVSGADAVYTDAWASMGQEHESSARAAVFQPYQVNSSLMACAAEHAVFMHCLPAHRGEEVTDEVIDSPQSVVFDQAENRLHIQKAILAQLLCSGTTKIPVRSARA